MSFQRRAIVPNDRFNRLLRVANLDPTTYRYDEEIEKYWGLYLDQQVKEDYLTQVSILANERIQTYKARVSQGRVFGQTFNLIVGQPIRLDLVNRHASTYDGVVTLAANQAVWWVRIINKGTGDLLYSINTMDNGSVLLPANSAPAIHESMTEEYEVINLQAVGSDATVNVAVEL